MVTFVKGKNLLGPVITIFGGIFGLIVGAMAAVDIYPILPSLPEALIPPIVSIILAILTLIVGILALINTKLIYFGAIILGIIGIIYMTTVPLPTPPLPEQYYTLLWIGPPIVLVGGVLSAITNLILKEK